MNTKSADSSLNGMLREAMPVAMSALNISGSGVGLVIVDEVNGFASVGCGNLAPPAENPQGTTRQGKPTRLNGSVLRNRAPNTPSSTPLIGVVS